MRQRLPDRVFTHHQLWAAQGGAAETSAKMMMGNLITDTGSTANPCFPRAVKLVRIGVHAACIAVNTAGDWTVRVRKNESGSDTATMGFAFAAVPGSKTAGVPNVQAIWQAGETYHVVCDGPSRNFIVIRVTLEWEVL